jgi:CO/xanthine dehydrogenase FAD-binding subunit
MDDAWVYAFETENRRVEVVVKTVAPHPGLAEEHSSFQTRRRAAFAVLTATVSVTKLSPGLYS